MTKSMPAIQHTIDERNLTLSRAVEMLGWQGGLLAQVQLLESRVSVVVQIDSEALARRAALDCSRPNLDWDTLTMWEWPEGAHAFPPAPLSITGLLFPGEKNPRQALVNARQWGGFGTSAITVPSEKSLGERGLLEASYFGIGVVSTDCTEGALILAARPGRIPGARRTTMDRWLEETLYGLILSDRTLSDALL